MGSLAPKVALLLAAGCGSSGLDGSRLDAGDGGSRDAGAAADAANDAGADRDASADRDAGGDLDAGLADAARSDAGFDCRGDRRLFRCCNGTETERSSCDRTTGELSCPDGFRPYPMENWETCGASEVGPADVEAGVACDLGSGDALLCELPKVCIESIATTCEPRPDAPHYRLLGCDGPEDCGAARCCLTDEAPESPRGAPPVYRTACERACATAALCNTDADCELGERCCNGPALFTRAPSGLCRTQCFE
jgi:hypothetical protein